MAVPDIDTVLVVKLVIQNELLSDSSISTAELEAELFLLLSGSLGTTIIKIGVKHFVSWAILCSTLFGPSAQAPFLLPQLPSYC